VAHKKIKTNLTAPCGSKFYFSTILVLLKHTCLLCTFHIHFAALLKWYYSVSATAQQRILKKIYAVLSAAYIITIIEILKKSDFFLFFTSCVLFAHIS